MKCQMKQKKLRPGNSNKNIFDIISKTCLNEEDEFKLFNYVKKRKLIFLSTPFSSACSRQINKIWNKCFQNWIWRNEQFTFVRLYIEI